MDADDGAAVGGPLEVKRVASDGERMVGDCVVITPIKQDLAYIKYCWLVVAMIEGPMSSLLNFPLQKMMMLARRLDGLAFPSGLMMAAVPHTSTSLLGQHLKHFSPHESS